MELFSEIYNTYYQILRSLLTTHSALTSDTLSKELGKLCTTEGSLYILPKLASGEWKLLRQDNDIYFSRISEGFYVPPTNLQKSFLKSLLQDTRMQLFLEDEQLTTLTKLLADVDVLWQPDTFYYYDQFQYGDPYDSPKYKAHFKTLLQAIHEKRLVDIEYESRKDHRVHHHYIPCRLEYSIKNNCFRLLTLKPTGHTKNRFEILNVERMTGVTLMDQTVPDHYDLNGVIRQSYYKEPVHLIIHNERNALERAMLHFASYEKNTTKIDDSTYECFIYYNRTMESELLIEVLSFGPMLKVLGNERFLKQLKLRLYKQRRLEM